MAELKAAPPGLSRRQLLKGATAAGLAAPLGQALLSQDAAAQAGAALPRINVSLPALSVAERDRRWAAVRENMAEPGWNLDAIITCFSDEWGSTARYLTQVGLVRYSGGAPQVIFPRDADKTVWVQMGGARHRDEWVGRLGAGGDWIDDGKMTLLAESGAADMAARLKSEGFGQRGTRIGIAKLSGTRFDVDGLVSATWLDTLKRELPGVEFLGIDRWGPDSGPIIKAAMVKSAEEQALIRRAVQANELALLAMTGAAREGASRQADLWWPAFIAMFAYTGEDFIRLSLGLDEGGNATLGEPVGDLVHAGQLCTQEISSAFQGYGSQVNHTFFIGSPSAPGYDYYREAIEVLGEIHVRAMDFIEPGRTTYGELMAHLAELQESMDAEGSGVQLHSGGIGFARPRMGTSPDEDIVIAPGHVFDWKPSVTLNPSRARDARPENRDVQLGESYVVTDRGVERLGSRSLGPIATHA